MNRGDVVVVRAPGTVTVKARPCVVVQRDSALAVASKVTVCPLTSAPNPAATRPSLSPDSSNGLRRISEVEVDWITTVPREFVGVSIGSLADADLRAVDLALRQWLAI